jgi:hypothetical protein
MGHPAKHDKTHAKTHAHHGTLARTQPQAPGPKGVQTGALQANKVVQGSQIVSFAEGKAGKRFGDGECFDLVDKALRHAGAKSAADFGRITDDANYKWGKQVSLSQLQPGDVIQFRNYRFDRKITRADGSWNTDFNGRPHHTAIVASVDGDGAVTVLEQNAPKGGPVQKTQLFFSDSNKSSGGTKTTITVKGHFWFYRPEAR